jgi:hypothetical protein
MSQIVPMEQHAKDAEKYFVLTTYILLNMVVDMNVNIKKL